MHGAQAFPPAGADLGRLTWAQAVTGWVIEVVAQPKDQRSFTVRPKRWIVERTFAWLGRRRRQRKDDEGRPDAREAWVQVVLIHLMLKPLAR